VGTGSLGRFGGSGLGVSFARFRSCHRFGRKLYAPTWRDASMALVLLSGLCLVLVALASYGLGGYMAGRLRSGLSPATPDEINFRVGVYGLLVWSAEQPRAALAIAPLGPGR
jgi:hypothetical protein